MPTTRNKRRRLLKRDPVERWKIDFLLTGELPAEDSFEALIFSTTTRREHPTRLGKVKPWFVVWEEIRNSDIVKNWKIKNGKTHVEKYLRML